MPQPTQIPFPKRHQRQIGIELPGSGNGGRREFEMFTVFESKLHMSDAQLSPRAGVVGIVGDRFLEALPCSLVETSLQLVVATLESKFGVVSRRGIDIR